MNDSIAESAVTALAKSWLESRGYLVTPDERFAKLVSPARLTEIFGVGNVRIHELLHHKNCPPFESEHGPTGRLLRLRLNPSLMSYLKRP